MNKNKDNTFPIYVWIGIILLIVITALDIFPASVPVFYSDNTIFVRAVHVLKKIPNLLILTTPSLISAWMIAYANDAETFADTIKKGKDKEEITDDSFKSVTSKRNMIIVGILCVLSLIFVNAEVLICLISAILSVIAGIKLSYFLKEYKTLQSDAKRERENVPACIPIGIVVIFLIEIIHCFILDRINEGFSTIAHMQISTALFAITPLVLAWLTGYADDVKIYINALKKKQNDGTIATFKTSTAKRNMIIVGIIYIVSEIYTTLIIDLIPFILACIAAVKLSDIFKEYVNLQKILKNSQYEEESEK